MPWHQVLKFRRIPGPIEPFLHDHAVAQCHDHPFKLWQRGRVCAALSGGPCCLLFLGLDSALGLGHRRSLLGFLFGFQVNRLHINKGVAHRDGPLHRPVTRPDVTSGRVRFVDETFGTSLRSNPGNNREERWEGQYPSHLTVPVEEAPANSVPAAAVIRGERALSGITGRKGRVGGLISQMLKPPA